ncbi:pyridoxal phosphate-dependent aminotransferase [Longimicrobium terrae]|uniref:Aspartate aminotransferase n=1 Tax=Longimicrobium terrae TaxID=1639882 RepID=A0A841H269_9BACT|nr:aminotransferase class I/II-fold pyridoxal phosphate-dependent enzyme [Longimicrobium terrae]MBB4637934.1 aspartate aminotransferase [Longimicrobium terrae]MBB6072181.1 aspartate aminotransferase [Longimicrobium terrae]
MTDGRVSTMAAGLIGSEILKIAADIRARVAQGEQICNLTVGDFSPAEFRIPEYLEREIGVALAAGETNYPPADGMLPLRQAVAAFLQRWLGLEYPLESVLITAGSRPGIYSVFTAIVDPGDVVVYPVPSWNNNHYIHMSGARGVPVVCHAENAFLPTRALLEDAVRGARLLALNSPLNPCGTAFTAEALGEICDLVLEENARRGPDERPLYVMYDQVYWMLTFGDTQHVNPVSLRPAMRDYTIFVDGISKSFAATGVRVGWTVGPADVTGRMASILGHVGAWAPRAEQIATARLLDATDEIRAYHKEMFRGVEDRLDALYDGIEALAGQGFPVHAITPMGAIYLSARFALHGWKTPAGQVLQTNEQIRQYLLESAGLAVVHFQAFGFQEESGWFRLSVGATSVAEIQPMLVRLTSALQALTPP